MTRNILLLIFKIFIWASKSGTVAVNYLLSPSCFLFCRDLTTVFYVFVILQ